MISACRSTAWREFAFLLRAVAGQEQGDLRGLRGARKGMLLDHLLRPEENNFRHGWVRADRGAVKESLTAPLPHRRKSALARLPQTQLARDHFLSEITFADEERHDENTGRGNLLHDGADSGFDFPEDSCTSAKILRRRNSSAC